MSRTKHSHLTNEEFLKFVETFGDPIAHELAIELQERFAAVTYEAAEAHDTLELLDDHNITLDELRGILSTLTFNDITTARQLNAHFAESVDADEHEEQH